MVPEGWCVKTVNDVLERVVDPVQVNPSKQYRQIGIRSHGKGLFHKEAVSGKALGNKRVFHIEKDCLVVNIVFAWEQAVAKTSEREVGMIASHRFPMFKPKDGKCDVDFILYFLKTPRGKYLLELASPGGAGRNKTLGQKEFASLKLLLPPVEEQKKIAKILSTWDKAIATAEQLLANSEQQKKALMQQLLTGKKRLPGFEGEWRKVELGDVLEYRQPTPYLVESTEYSDEYKTPVLTAGKTFILGDTDEDFGIFKEGLPVIIFDDFTTSSRFVDSEFKVKSSAMKILSARAGHSIKYVFEAMQMIRYAVGGHQRHWISIFANLVVPMPPLEEQEAIASALSSADDEIKTLRAYADRLKAEKKALMQQLLTGKRRVQVDDAERSST